ncbi:MAG: SET domain-containing protein [Saprospiraceae bacterium]
MTEKTDLLRHLREETFIRLQPSGIHGTGVFAIRDIPAGSDNFFSDSEDEWIHLTYSDVGSLPTSSQFLIETYCLFDHLGYFVPAHGFEKMDLSLFLNHSDTPNIASVNDGESFVALRQIHAGEELLVDYGTIVQE